ncbi:MAG: RHS repeat-associated core domain-containing protein, partial [Cyclobacteriaceae bacterium]
GANAFEQLTLDFIPEKEGYLFVYVSNEEPVGRDVYFDDLKIVHNQSIIAQTDSYYPFGLSHGNMSMVREGRSKNQFLYNGKELVEGFDLGWYDYGARMYDPQLGRFFTQDRFTEKYFDFSPYQYAANNPILYIDINGDSLSVNGTASATQQFTDLANKGLGGSASVSVGKDGNVSLSKKNGKMNKQQMSFYKDLKKVVKSKGTTSIGLVENDSGVEIGSFDQESIDVSDLANLGSSDLSSEEAVSAQGALIHEVTEQFEKQVNGTGLMLAHTAGTAAENRANGSKRIEKGATVVQDKAGNNIGSSLNSSTSIRNKASTLNIIIMKGNVRGVLINGVPKKK